MFILVAGPVSLVLSLCPWTGKTFASWNKIHTKSAGKPTAHGGSIVNGVFFTINDFSSTYVNTDIALRVTDWTHWLSLPIH